MKAAACIDHLVVAGATLAECVQWCETTLGVTPGPGGQHPLMGTHNRLLDLSTAEHPNCYLELLAIEASATPARAPGQRRWFDLDDDNLQRRLRTEGPRLIHFAARVPDAQAGVRSLAAATPAIARGEVVRAARNGAGGRLEWQITVRDDGRRLMHGLLPTLIQWGELHPTHGMTPSGLALEALACGHPEPAVLRDAYARIGLRGVAVRQGPPQLSARLRTPNGTVELESGGI